MNENYYNTEDVNSSSQRRGLVAKKIGLMCILGILFGSCAALSFFIIGDVNNQLQNRRIQQNSIIQGNEIGLNSSEIGELQNTNTTTSGVTDVTEVVDQVMPSIVSITNSYQYSTYFYDSTAQASGSGIIIGQNDDELLIVTNEHVIEGADELAVTFSNDDEADAIVKGHDISMDLAVIAVSLNDIDTETKDIIKIAQMGNSDNLKVGEPVIAIGNALGYGQSVTTGVISAKDRELDMGGTKGTFLQTDAAINPGNSGGALLDLNGNVIGINSNKIGGSSVEGMGYAIPISFAEPIIEELMQREIRIPVAEDKQGALGISGATITTQESAYYGYPRGVYVAKVYPDSAAEEAGIREGDFVTSVNGQDIYSMEELQQLLSTYEAGTTVEIGISRSSRNGYQDRIEEVTLQSKQYLDE